MSVIYKDQRIVKKVTIPDIKDSEVELYSTILWGDLEKIYDTEGTELHKGRKALACLVKDWNLTDDKGVKLPITDEVFKQFTPSVINFLLSETEFGKGDLLGKKK